MKGIGPLGIALAVITILSVSGLSAYFIGQTQFGIKPEGSYCVQDSDCASNSCRFDRTESVLLSTGDDVYVPWTCPSNSAGCTWTSECKRCTYPQRITSPSETGSMISGQTNQFCCMYQSYPYICDSCFLGTTTGFAKIQFNVTYKKCAGVVCGDGVINSGEECEPSVKLTETCPTGGTKKCKSDCKWSTCLDCNDHNPCTTDSLVLEPWGCSNININSGSVGNGYDDNNCGGYYANCLNWECDNGVCKQKPTATGSHTDCPSPKYCSNGLCATPNCNMNGVCENNLQESNNNCPNDCPCGYTNQCGNNIIEPNCGEKCDTSATVRNSTTCQDGTCNGHQDVTYQCNSCQWVITPIPPCIKDNGCCDVNCGQNTITCPADSCNSENKWCDYSTSVTCDNTCSPLSGGQHNCIQCSKDCPVSCNYVIGKCGVTCTSDGECGTTQPTCTPYCDNGKYCTFPSASPCQKTCVLGVCQPCSPSCGSVSCNLNPSQCNIACTTPGNEVPCSSASNNCGYKTCQSNGQYNDCYAKNICTSSQDCVENPTGTFTCQPKEVRITHTIQPSYSVGSNIIVIAEIPYFPIANPVYSTLYRDETQLQQVECSYTTGIKWSCSFFPVTSGGLYKVKTQVTNPNTGLTVSKEDQLIVREALVVAFTTTNYEQYLGKDIIAYLSVTPFTSQVTKSLKATLYSGLGLFPEEITVVPTYIPTGGNTWDVKIPAGQIMKAGNLKIQMTVGDISGQYEPVTKEITIRISELKPIIKIEAPSSVTLDPTTNSKIEQIIFKTYLGTDLVDVDRLEVKVTFAGQEKLFTKSDMTHLDTGKYSLSFTFTQSQNHYFKASIWIGLASNYADVNVPVGGGTACACDIERGTCQSDCSCDIDCKPEIPWTTIAIAGAIIGGITLSGIALWRRG